MPTEYYNQETEQERHYKSIEASAEIAEKASMLALERDWPYEKALNYIMRTEPELSELSKHGYISEKPAKTYSMTSYEASAKLAEKVKELQRIKKLSFDEAHTRVFAAEENQELVTIYSQGE